MTINHAQAERFALCDLFQVEGPDAETLCEGWTNRDLAAHLIVRETRPDAALGIIVAPIARHGERVRRTVAARPWTDLVEAVRSGPPRWSPMRPAPIDRAANTLEFFVHHEDVRRAQPDWEPRALDAGLESELWKIISRMAKVMVRKAASGVVLMPPTRSAVVARRAKAGEANVELRGDISELVMFVEGRQAHSRVELDGPEAAADALRSASFGI